MVTIASARYGLILSSAPCLLPIVSQQVGAATASTRCEVGCLYPTSHCREAKSVARSINQETTALQHAWLEILRYNSIAYQ